MFAFLKLRRSGSRDVGFKSGSAEAARARSRSCSMAGRGRAASIRWRIVWSSAITFAAACRLVGSYSEASRYSPRAASSWSCSSKALRLVEMRTRRGELRAFERDLVVRIVGSGL